MQEPCHLPPASFPSTRLSPLRWIENLQELATGSRCVAFFFLPNDVTVFEPVPGAGKEDGGPGERWNPVGAEQQGPQEREVS